MHSVLKKTAPWCTGRIFRGVRCEKRAFPEVECLLEGLRKRLRMLAAWAAKDGIHLGLPAVNYKTTVKEKDVLIQLTEVNLEKPEVPGFLTSLEAVGS